MRTWAIKGRGKPALVPVLALALAVLTGCAPLLERTYTTVEPHSSRFWDSESSDILRAENYQDIVNDLLLLIGQHTESATLRLYGFQSDQPVSDLLERAGVEIQQETPLGAYAVEYLTSSVQSQRGYYEVSVQIGYRRTAEQIQALVNATSPEAIYSLLESALDGDRTEVAVRVSYWGPDGRARVEDTITRLREERGLTEEEHPWLVYYYPAGEEVGLVEFLLDPPPELLEQEALRRAELEGVPDPALTEDGTGPGGEGEASAGEETSTEKIPEENPEESPKGNP